MDNSREDREPFEAIELHFWQAGNGYSGDEARAGSAAVACLQQEEDGVVLY